MKTPLVLLALFALCSGAFAQDQNAAKLALARDVIAAVQADKAIDAMLAQLKQMAAQSAAFPPGATSEQRAKAEKLQADILDLSMQSAKKLITQLDHLYADVYTEAELKAMKAFFTSPEGKSMVEKQPQVMARMTPLMQQMQQELLPKVQALTAAAKAE